MNTLVSTGAETAQMIIEQNPYAKLLPDADLSNDIFPSLGPRGLHQSYRTGVLHGVILPGKTQEVRDIVPEFYRKYAAYNLEGLKRNQPDGQSIIFEETSYYQEIKGASEGKMVMNHKLYQRVDPLAGKGNQATGDCVSWAIRNAWDQLRAIMIYLLGKFEKYRKRTATCGIYSGRGHTGQGADPVGLSAHACEIGTLLEQVYTTALKSYDFTNYDNYVSWGMSRGRSGVPADLLELTKPYTAGGYKIVETTDALADALISNMTAHIGSMLGVSSMGDPLSRRSGSWSHDMSVVGFDHRLKHFQKRIWAWDQSWGNWNTVINVPDDYKPLTEGMFFVDDSVTQYALNGGGGVVFLPGRFFPEEGPSNEI